MRHWAADLVGKPWAADGEGPDAFSCWGLVRWVFRSRHGVVLPMVLDAENRLDVGEALHSARASGWRPVEDAAARADDVVLMRSAVRLHVGLAAVPAAGAVGVLHSTHERGVVWQDWAGATQGMQVELWRRRA